MPNATNPGGICWIIRLSLRSREPICPPSQPGLWTKQASHFVRTAQLEGHSSAITVALFFGALLLLIFFRLDPAKAAQPPAADEAELRVAVAGCRAFREQLAVVPPVQRAVLALAEPWAAVAQVVELELAPSVEPWRPGWAFAAAGLEVSDFQRPLPVPLPD